MIAVVIATKSKHLKAVMDRVDKLYLSDSNYDKYKFYITTNNGRATKGVPHFGNNLRVSAIRQKCLEYMLTHLVPKKEFDYYMIMDADDTLLPVYETESRDNIQMQVGCVRRVSSLGEESDATYVSLSEYDGDWKRCIGKFNISSYFQRYCFREDVVRCLHRLFDIVNTKYHLTWNWGDECPYVALANILWYKNAIYHKVNSVLYYKGGEATAIPDTYEATVAKLRDFKENNDKCIRAMGIVLENTTIPYLVENKKEIMDMFTVQRTIELGNVMKAYLKDFQNKEVVNKE